MKKIIPMVVSLSLMVSTFTFAQTQPGPYKLAPQQPVAPQAPAQNNTKLLNDSYEQTSKVIAFVEENMQLSQLCDERLKTDQHSAAFAKWFATQKNNFNATLEFKFTYEKMLAALYDESIIETFQKRDRLTLTQVANDIALIAARDDASFSSSCKNWYNSIEDKGSFFHTQLSIGINYFGLNREKLAKLVIDPQNW